MNRRAGQISRAQTLWSLYGPAAVRILLSYERDPDLRQDLAQEVFLAVMDSIERIEAAANPRAYLLRIVHNVAIDHVARESRHSWVQLDEAIEDPLMDPQREVHAATEAERLLRAVHRLRLPYRQVLVLVLEGLDGAEIAGILGIPAGTVRVRLMRAREKLKELLGHD